MKRLATALSFLLMVAPAFAEQLGFRLEVKKHPVGTRILSPCSTSARNPEASSSHHIYSDSDVIVYLNSGCYRERFIEEWSPSGDYVKLRTTVEKEGAGDWYKVSEFAALEILSGK